MTLFSLARLHLPTSMNFRIITRAWRKWKKRLINFGPKDRVARYTISLLVGSTHMDTKAHYLRDTDAGFPRQYKWTSEVLIDGCMLNGSGIIDGIMPSGYN